MKSLVYSAFFVFLFHGALVLNATNQAAPKEPVAPAAKEEGRELQGGERVVAEVVLLRYRAAKVRLEDGILPACGMELRIIEPAGVDKPVHVMSFGHPQIGLQPLLLGNLVRFMLPEDWVGNSLFIEQLRELSFANQAPVNAGLPRP